MALFTELVESDHPHHKLGVYGSMTLEELKQRLGRKAVRSVEDCQKRSTPCSTESVSCGSPFWPGGLRLPSPCSSEARRCFAGCPRGVAPGPAPLGVRVVV